MNSRATVISASCPPEIPCSLFLHSVPILGSFWAAACLQVFGIFHFGHSGSDEYRIAIDCSHSSNVVFGSSGSSKDSLGTFGLSVGFSFHCFNFINSLTTHTPYPQAPQPCRPPFSHSSHTHRLGCPPNTLLRMCHWVIDYPIPLLTNTHRQCQRITPPLTYSVLACCSSAFTSAQSPLCSAKLLYASLPEFSDLSNASWASTNESITMSIGSMYLSSTRMQYT